MGDTAIQILFIVAFLVLGFGAAAAFWLLFR